MTNIETNTLGSFLVDYDSQVYIGQLTELDYTTTCNQEIFREIKKLYDAEESIDLVVLIDKLPHLNEYLLKLADDVISSVNTGNHVKKLREKTRGKTLTKLAEDFVTDVRHGEDIDASLGALYTSLAQEDRATSIVSMGETVREFVHDFEKRCLEPDGSIYRTGFKYLDDEVFIRNGNLIIIAARPSTGKTVLGLNIAEHLAQMGRKVHFYSLEMKNTYLAERLIARRAKINLTKIQYPKNLSPESMNQITSVIKSTSELSITFERQRNVDIGVIETECKRLRAQNKLDVLFIDFLQLIKFHGSIYEGVSDNILRLQKLAWNLDIPVFVLAQLNRLSTNRTDFRPYLSDLRDTGKIEEAADIVLMLHRPEAIGKGSDPRETELFIRKNRSGSKGEVQFDFIGEFQEFRSKEPGEGWEDKNGK